MQINLVNREIDYLVEGKQGWKDGNLMRAIKERGLDVKLPWPVSVEFQVIPGSFLVTMMKAGFSPLSCEPYVEAVVEEEVWAGETQVVLIDEIDGDFLTGAGGVKYAVTEVADGIGAGEWARIEYTEDETGFVTAVRIFRDEIFGASPEGDGNPEEVNAEEHTSPDPQYQKKELRAALKDLGVRTYGFENIERLEEMLKTAKEDTKPEAVVGEGDVEIFDDGDPVEVEPKKRPDMTGIDTTTTAEQVEKDNKRNDKFIVVIERGGMLKFDKFVKKEWGDIEDAIAWADNHCRIPGVLSFSVAKIVTHVERVKPAVDPEWVATVSVGIPERVPVESSHIASIGYNPEKTELEVEFLSGAVYRYAEVPQHLYQNLMGADSIGAYFADYVQHAYEYEKVAEENLDVTEEKPE